MNQRNSTFRSQLTRFLRSSCRLRREINRDSHLHIRFYWLALDHKNRRGRRPDHPVRCRAQNFLLQRLFFAWPDYDQTCGNLTRHSSNDFVWRSKFNAGGATPSAPDFAQKGLKPRKRLLSEFVLQIGFAATLYTDNVGQRLPFEDVEQHELGSMCRGQLDRSSEHCIASHLQIESSQDHLHL